MSAPAEYFDRVGGLVARQGSGQTGFTWRHRRHQCGKMSSRIAFKPAQLAELVQLIDDRTIAADRQRSSAGVWRGQGCSPAIVATAVWHVSDQRRHGDPWRAAGGPSSRRWKAFGR